MLPEISVPAEKEPGILVLADKTPRILTGNFTRDFGAFGKKAGILVPTKKTSHFNRKRLPGI